jgi:metal-responsive CopG/Arc/MetJ family transcriptional regulator
LTSRIFFPVFYKKIREKIDTRDNMEYIGSMKVKTSVTLSDDLLKSIDEQSGPQKNRSEFIEKALRIYIGQLIRDRQNARDFEIINLQADRLNKEAADVLSYQVIP